MTQKTSDHFPPKSNPEDSELQKRSDGAINDDPSSEPQRPQGLQTRLLDDIPPHTSDLGSCIEVLNRYWSHDIASQVTKLPATIGRFQIEQLLGVGGFGVVYKAFDPILCRPVALKIPSLRSLSSEKLIVRFEQEAKLAASLDHPNIVPIHETGHADSVCYIAQAYCTGPNLADWLKLRKTSVPERIAVLIITRLTAAVIYSHSKGVLHRDLKPSNVLLDPDATKTTDSGGDQLAFTPRLTDFGLAKLLSSELDASATQADTMLLGTPPYMAPEQTGKGTVGPAVDVYGLGAILYELLTGRPPFQGSSAADLFNQIRHTEPVAPRQLRREISRDLEIICLKCLDKIPKKRFESARALATDLERWLRNEPIESRPITTIEWLWRWCCRKPATSALIGVSIISLVIIVAMVFLHERHLGILNRELVDAAYRATHMQRIAEENEQKTRDALYVADIGRAATAWKFGDTRAQQEFLNRHIPKPGEIDRRGFEWQFLRKQSDRSSRVLLEGDSAVYHICYSPDHSVIAAAGFDATVRLIDAQNGRLIQEIRTEQIEVNCVAFSPDGKEIATSGDDGTIRIWDLNSTRSRLTFKAHAGKAFQLLYTADGRQIVSCGDNPVIRVFDPESGTEQPPFVGHAGEIQTIYLSKDMKSLYSSGSDSKIRKWDFSLRKEMSVIDCDSTPKPFVVQNRGKFLIAGMDLPEVRSYSVTNPRLLSMVTDIDRVVSMALDPTERMLAVANRGGRIRLWNVDSAGQLTESPCAPWQAHSKTIYSLMWSHDGSRLISAGDDGRVISWSKTAIQLSNPQKLQLDICQDSCLVPGTDVMVFGNFQPWAEHRSLSNWNAVGRVSTELDEEFTNVVASPNGSYLAGVVRRRAVRLFRVRTTGQNQISFEPIAFWQADGELFSPRWSPDSSSIAVSHWRRPYPDQPEKQFVSIFRAPDLTLTEEIPVPYARAMEFTPDGRNLAIARRSGLTLWNLDRNAIDWEVDQQDLSFFELSPDGSLIATGGLDRMIVLRNTSDGSIRHQMAGHRGRIRSVSFSPDGRTLATGDAVGTVKLWSATVGQELFQFENPGMKVEQILFTSDGHRLLVRRASTGDHEIDELLIFDAGHSPS